MTIRGYGSCDSLRRWTIEKVHVSVTCDNQRCGATRRYSPKCKPRNNHRCGTIQGSRVVPDASPWFNRRYGTTQKIRPGEPLRQTRDVEQPKVKLNVIPWDNRGCATIQGFPQAKPLWQPHVEHYRSYTPRWDDQKQPHLNNPVHTIGRKPQRCGINQG